MFSILSNKLTYSDLKASVENARQTRPFEVVRTGSSSNRDIKPGYKGNTILKDSYFFTNILFDSFIPLKNGDRILLYGQTNEIENGIWNVMSIVNGFVNIQRPTDYAKNTPIRQGQCVLIVEGQTLSGKIFKNTTTEYDSNQNKIIAYNGTSPQTWQEYTSLNLTVLKPINKVSLYTGFFYSGTRVELDIGEYPYIPDTGIPNNSLSSLTIPPGYKVELYSGYDFTNQTITLTQDTNSLLYVYNEVYGDWTNIVSSIKISLA